MHLPRRNNRVFICQYIYLCIYICLHMSVFLYVYVYKYIFYLILKQIQLSGVYCTYIYIFLLYLYYAYISARHSKALLMLFTIQRLDIFQRLEDSATCPRDDYSDILFKSRFWHQLLFWTVYIHILYETWTINSM